MELSFQNVDAFCARIELEQERPVIALSQLEWIEPFAVIYLGQFLRYHNRSGKAFDVDPPRDEKVRKYLARIRFWDRFNFSRDVVEKEGMLQFTTPTSLNNIVELVPDTYIADSTTCLVQEVLASSNVKVNARAVLEAVGELVDNFAQHAHVDLATLAVQYYPTRMEFAVAVGDSGWGIRRTLCENPEYAYLAERQHCEAILKAFDPLVSRREYAGTGLTNVRDSVVQLGGSLRVASNDGFVYIESGKTLMGQQKYELPGVQIEVRFPEV